MTRLFTAPSLLEALDQADLIEIDDTSIRHFYMDQEVLGNDEEPDMDAVALDISFTDDDLNRYEFFFTLKHLTEAKYNKSERAWFIDYQGESIRLACHKLITIVEGIDE